MRESDWSSCQSAVTEQNIRESKAKSTVNIVIIVAVCDVKLVHILGSLKKRKTNPSRVEILF